MAKFDLTVSIALFLFVVTADSYPRKMGLRQRMLKLSEATSKIDAVEPQEDAAPSYDSIYSEWSSWGRCTKRCREVRSRNCQSVNECGTSVLKEERPCSGGRCRDRPIVVPHTGEVTQKGRSPSEFRVLYHLQSVVYSSWSEWSSCTRACRTRRYRNCEMSLVCGNSVIQEDALCYQEGSTCEKIYKKKKEKAKNQEEELVLWKEEEANGKTNPLDEQECGIPKFENTDISLRIIGGRESVKGRWPWQVIILNRFKEPFCGGTILTPYWLITAAHCVRKRLYVRAGEHDLQETEGTEQEIRVEESIVNPDYDVDTVDNDIALLRLKTPLTFNDHVKAICLPESDEALPLNIRAFILGWGKRRNTALYGTDVLHEAEVPVVDIEECKSVYDDYYISENMMCAGYKRGRVDSCAGDSGGPLLYKADKTWAIYGVTSFGEGCGRKGKYGIYTKVSNYVRWIRRTIASTT